MKDRILIIEDDALLSDFYKKFIEFTFPNIECDICKNGKEVRDSVAKYNNDYWLMFLCDLNVPSGDGNEGEGPVFNGFELIEDCIPACKTVIASGYFSPEIAVQARNLGVAALFQKPPNLSALSITINFLLNCITR
jgi:Response regulator containing CheY-like receiver, AAA-type ATPase, and DNA-binding domains